MTSTAWQPTNWMTPYPEPLDDAAYYGVVGEIVRTLAPQTEADPVGILAAALGACGNAIGTCVYAEVGGKRHHARLNTLLIGPTAARKGTAQAVADAVLDVAAPAWRKQRRVSGLSSGEGLIFAVRDELVGKEPIRGKNKEILRYQDVILDPGVADKRLFVVEEEFGRTLRVLNREHNTLSSVLRDAWDGNPLHTLTKQAAHATDTHISIAGHITPAELRELLRSQDIANGLANRFLLFAVRRSQLLPRGAALDAGAVNYLGTQLDQAFEDLRRREHRLERDAAAFDLWDEVYPHLSRDRDGLAGALTSRAEAQVLRLSVLYAALDVADAIQLPHLRAALAVWRYCEDSAGCLFGSATGDPVMDTILAGLERKALTRTEISNLFGRHIAADQLDETLELLCERGRLGFEDQKTGGRSKRVYALVRAEEQG